ncbi:hypothetical protein GmHk_19G054557 [Glycine max]|nr:hypothetical protein GmHk_19G054557 [Glycine max]KAH1193530.1 hypothetical protein GmHk_19G054557 [Glycine max]KAH1193531.1 hypothetical protein GmHk_19G054557 [Glycine max]
MSWGSSLSRDKKSDTPRSLATRPVGAKRPLVHVDPATGKADGSHRKKLRTYLGIIARDKDLLEEQASQEVGPSTTCVNIKESCIDPSGNDPDMSDSKKCGLYVEENPSCLVALGRLYEGSTTVHNMPLRHDQLKVDVEEVKDIFVPTQEVQLVGQTLNTFVTWPIHLVKRLLEQVMWDATMFGKFNDDFHLYIKHEDLSEIAHGGRCLNISVIQLLILHMIEKGMRAGNSDVYGFLEPQFIQRSEQSQFESESYIKNLMHNLKRDVYLGAYLADAHWQMVVILPKENVVIWFCSFHNRPDNYLKGIINSALKGLDDTPQSKSKTATKWIVVKV